MGVLKSPGTPSIACVRRAFWQYHYLRAFSGVDSEAPGIKSNWCICSIRDIYVQPFESHTSGGGPSIYSSYRGLFLQSRPQRVRKLQPRLEKYTHLCAGIFFSAQMYYQFGYVTPHFMEVNEFYILLSSVWYLDIVLSILGNYALFILPQ